MDIKPQDILNMDPSQLAAYATCGAKTILTANLIREWVDKWVEELETARIFYVDGQLPESTYYEIQRVRDLIMADI